MSGNVHVCKSNPNHHVNMKLTDAVSAAYSQPGSTEGQRSEGTISPAGQSQRHLLEYTQIVQAAEASPNATVDPLLAVRT